MPDSGKSWLVLLEPSPCFVCTDEILKMEKKERKKKNS